MLTTTAIEHLPHQPRFDAPLWGVVRGATPTGKARVGMRTRDDFGQSWFSSCTLTADSTGVVDLAAATHADISDSDAYRCYWSMRPDSATAPPGLPAAVTSSPDIAFADVRSRSFDIDVTVDAQRALGTIERRPMAAAVLDEWRDGIVANAFTSTRSDRRPGIAVVVGGSTGGFAWSNQVAALLATSGIDALAVAYHDWSRTHGLPDRIEEQPLELFAVAARRFCARPDAGSGPVIGVGFSKGAEALLALAQRDTVFDRVVAVAPSSHVFEGVRPDTDGPERSCWSWNGEPLPFTPVRLDPAFYDDYDQSRLLAAHTSALNEANPASRIDLTEAQTDVLLISSTADETWPAVTMAEDLAQANGVTAVTLNGAGHLLLPPGYPAARGGGSALANATGDRQMWGRLRRFVGIT